MAPNEPPVDLQIRIEDAAGKTSIRGIDRLPFTIGRVEGNDLVLHDPSVSRHHASIVRDGGDPVIVDQGSRNGVFVNDLRANGPVPIGPGDRIRIGMVRLAIAGVEWKIRGSPGSNDTIQYVPPEARWDLGSSATAAAPSPTGLEKCFRLMLRLFTDASLPDACESIIDIVEASVPFDRCFLILFDDSLKDRLRIVARRDRRGTTSQVIISTTILNRVAGSREAVLVSARGPETTESFIRSNASSALCMPLVIAGKAIGVIYLDRLLPASPFTAADIDGLGPLAGVIALKIENLRLIDAQIALRMNKKEMGLAKSIQEGFLPKGALSLPGWSVEGATAMCQEVGGDYFDFLIPREGELFLVIGDISGKGLAASLYMAAVRSALHAHLEGDLPVPVLMARLERNIRSTFRSDHFLTLFVGKIEMATGRITYSNAGHPPPLVHRPGGPLEELEVTDPALNLATPEEYGTRIAVLEPGDTLFLYTDGLIEEAGPGGDRFGRDRLAACFEGCAGEGLPAIRKKVFDEVEGFARAEGPGDDRTILLCRREAGMSAPFAAREEVFRAAMPARLERREGLIADALRALEESGCRPDPFVDRLILDEAISNAVIHGSGRDPSREVRLRLFVSPARWGAEVTDEGPGFDWRAAIARAEATESVREASGRGLLLMKRTCSALRFLDGGRRLLLIRPRDAAPGEPGADGPVGRTSS